MPQALDKLEGDNLISSAAGSNHQELHIATRNKKLLGAPGIATRSKDATRGSWPYY